MIKNCCRCSASPAVDLGTAVGTATFGYHNATDFRTATYVSPDCLAAWNAAFLPSNDLGEAVNAFLERRAPTYGGG